MSSDGLYHAHENIDLWRGAGVAQWLKHRIRDRQVAGLNPGRNGGRIFFSRVKFLCCLIFWYPFHLRVTAVASKRSWSFGQKYRWQVTATRIQPTYVALPEVTWDGACLYGVHRTRRDGSSFTWQQSCNNQVSRPLWWIFKIRHRKLQSLS